jgi:hypothetical protein
MASNTVRTTGSKRYRHTLEKSATEEPEPSKFAVYVEAILASYEPVALVHSDMVRTSEAVSSFTYRSNRHREFVGRQRNGPSR